MHKVMTVSEMAAFTAKLVADGIVYGVVNKDSQYAWDRIIDPREIVLDYPTTISSPKKYFLPPTETLIKFKLAAEPAPEAVNFASEAVLFGMHACDLYAASLLDIAFADTNRDLNYLEKRLRATLIGVSCQPDGECFCDKMGVDEAVHDPEKIKSKSALYDVFITNAGYKYIVTVGTCRGEELLERYGVKNDASEGDIARMRVVESKRRESFINKLKLDAEELPKLLPKVYDSPVWKEYADRCFACGTCNLVCPTCYCFNIVENVHLNLKEGEREREWDSCMLPQFAQVAGGESFREHIAQRLRHRLMRKGLYIREKFGKSGCVGCGRCIRNCTADISITQMYNRLKEVSENE